MLRAKTGRNASPDITKSMARRDVAAGPQCIDRLSDMTRILAAPPNELEYLVRYFHVEIGCSGEALLPASPFPILTVIVQGGTSMETANGVWTPSPTAFIAGPASCARRYRATAGTRAISALIRPGRLSHLFAVPVQQLADVRWPLEMIASPASVSMLVDQLREQRSPHGWVKRVGDWILRQASYASSIRPTLSVAFEELTQPPRRLARRFGVGLRQFERRFVSAYGQNLRDMRKLARFTNALTVVMTGGESAGRLAQIAVDLGYFDQPHMTRDFMELAGVTPGRLIDSAAGLDPALRLLQYSACELRLLRSANERDCRFTRS